MRKHVHEFWEEGDNKENNKKEERSFEKSNKQIYTRVKKNCIMASMAVGSDDEESYDDE